MNNELENFSNTIGLIYEAGLDSDKWPFVLQALCDELDADKAQILYLEPREYMISFACCYGFDPFTHNISAGRFRNYFFDDPIAQYGISHLNEVFANQRAVDIDTLNASGMQREIRQPEGMAHMLTTFLTDGSLDWSGFCFFRNADQPQFSADDEITLSRYTDHLKRATYFHKSMAGAANFKHLQNAVLDTLDSGIVVVDELHDVVICNKSAQQSIDNSGVLRLKDSRLTCRYSKENALLHESIDQALGADAHYSSKRKIAVRLRGSDFSKNLLMVTTPLQVQNLEEKNQHLPMLKAHYTARIPSRKHALISLCAPQSVSGHSQEMLQNLFGLTPAEAALADMLADDFSLESASEELGRAVGTARIQLQSIFEKTDTNRQSSLIRLIMSIP